MQTSRQAELSNSVPNETGTQIAQKHRAEASSEKHPHEQQQQQHQQQQQQQHLSQRLNTHPNQLLKSLTKQQEQQIVLQKYGVSRIEEDGLVQYRLGGSGDNKILIEAKPGAGEFIQSQHKLDELTQAKIADLKSKYDVTFGLQGEDAVRPWIVSKTNQNKLVPGAMLHSRVPRLSELMGVDAALQASQPSQFLGSHGKEALKFYFLTTPTYGDKTYDSGLYAANEHHKNSVFFEPDAEPDRPITVADAIEKHQEIKTSFEALVAHEIAHNAEWNMGLWDPDKLNPLAEKLGWTTSTDSQFWLLKGKQGEYYRLTNDGLSSDKGWIACDAAGKPLDAVGNPLDAAGKPLDAVGNPTDAAGKLLDTTGVPLDAAGTHVTDAASAPHLTDAEVREKALVRPPTSYFTAPEEMLADALMLYRVGEVGRAELRKSGDQLFEVVKKFDQEEVNSRFGKNADGTSKKIRSPNGDLTDNKIS